MGNPEPDGLSRFERAALAMLRFTNENRVPKRIQQRYLRGFSQSWIWWTVANRTYVSGIEWLRQHRPDRGVVLASNHRSFFDQYVSMLAMYECGVEWVQRTYFPVRSNFFYERALGVLVNFGISGGVMYPPIFRDNAKSEYNKDALDRVVGFLREPGVLVGIHPEGTRGKGPDPYELLPAQPGIGQIVLHAKPVVVPVFLNGLRNELLSETIDNYTGDIRRRRPVIICFGEPVDYSEYTTKAPRVALYKRTADRIRAAIIDLQAVEKDIRARCAAGEIADDAPHWLLEQAIARRDSLVRSVEHRLRRR